MKQYVYVVFNVSTKDAFSGTGKEYVFACYEDAIYEGDIVVVDTRYGFQLATVSKIGVKVADTKGLKDVVCKVNMTEFQLRQEKAAKRAEIKAEMDKRVKELQASAIYEMLAEKDDSLKQMLQAYKGLEEE